MARKQGFVVYLDEDAKRRLQDMAIRTGQPMNYIIRAAIEQYIQAAKQRENADASQRREVG
jgi:predicted transcriptional regulator